MSEPIEDSEFEELQEQTDVQMEPVTASVEMKSVPTRDAVAADCSSLSAIGTASLTMNVQLSCSASWCRKFLEARPSDRAILLTSFLEDFADGVDGIFVSFSEPKYHES